MNKLNDVSDKFSKMLVSKNTMDDKNSFPTEKPTAKSKNSEVILNFNLSHPPFFSSRKGSLMSRKVLSAQELSEFCT